ncbi:MAG: mandelate racemase/muconate lactonizing enzyme family protein [Phycicoccus sp.]
MKIDMVETFRTPAQPNICLVRLTDEDGVTGLGEGFFHASSIDAFVHDSAAPELIDVGDATPNTVSEMLRPYVGFQGGGVETRARGAIDIALWDLLGKRAGMPLHELLGGRVRDGIRIYNTCAGTRYVGSSGWQTSANWNPRPGEWEDLWAFVNRPEDLAGSLLAEGITGMKIWPFDEAAERSRGVAISPAELDAGVSIVRRIRDAVGDRIDVMIELHGLWDVAPAIAIATALEPYRITWLEDPVRSDIPSGLTRVRAATAIPIAAGETVTGPQGFHCLLDADAIDVATVDIQWTGGLTEALRVAQLCETRQVPIAPHDCTGPVTLATSLHLVSVMRNALVQETARAFLRSWYPPIVEGLPPVEEGWLRASSTPGHGVALRESFVADSATIRRETRGAR